MQLWPLAFVVWGQIVKIIQYVIQLHLISDLMISWEWKFAELSPQLLNLGITASFGAGYEST